MKTRNYSLLGNNPPSVFCLNPVWYDSETTTQFFKFKTKKCRNYMTMNDNPHDVRVAYIFKPFI